MRKKLGRPKLAEDKTRSKVLTLRLSIEERKRIQKASDKAGLSPSEWARKVLQREASDDIRIT